MANLVHGVAIRPRVSRNGRRYTAETVKRAYDRLSARLADGQSRPVTMRSFHPAPGGEGARVTAIVGHLTKVGLTSDGAITYEAQLEDTVEGKTVAQLNKPGADGRPSLANVSIRGWWVGETRTDGEGFETGDDLEIDGLDFTDSPGIPEASAAPGALETARALIYESVEEAFVDMTEPAIVYADPGYRDGKPCLPLTTETEIRAAWAAVNETGAGYTRKQTARVKGKIKSAAKGHGINLATETYESNVKQLIDTYAAMVPESARPAFLEEAYACVSISNGPADISVSSWGNDCAQLQAVIARLSAAVSAALDAVDPDHDGDIDLPGAESAPAGLQESAGPAATGKEPTVATDNKPAEETKAEDTKPELTAESIATAVVGALVPALTEAFAKVAAPAAAPAAETKPADTAATTETAPAGDKPAEETAKPKTEAELREELKAEVRNELLNESRNGSATPERKGLAKKLTEEDFDLSKLSEDERRDVVGQALFMRLFPQQAAALGA